MHVETLTNTLSGSSTKQSRLPDLRDTTPENPQMGKVQDDAVNSAASIFSPPRSDAPWWVIPILTFICGVAITAAILKPDVASSDYQRGNKDGYTHGWNDAQVAAEKNDDVWFNKGLTQGRRESTQSP